MLGIVSIVLQLVINAGLIYGIHILRKRVDKLEQGRDNERQHEQQRKK